MSQPSSCLIELLLCFMMTRMAVFVALFFLPRQSMVTSMALLSPYRTLRLVPVTSDTICPLHSSHLCHFLSDEEAQWVVTEAETFTVSGGGDWLTDRHAQYATTDFAVEDCPTLRNWWNPRIEETVLPTLAKLYDVARSDLELDDLFIVKYEASEAADAGLGGGRGGGAGEAGGERPSRATQDRLANHHDDTLLSFSVLLSDPHRDFEGGGTSFAASDWMKEEQGGEVDFRSVVEEVDAFDESRLIDVVKPAGRGDLFCHCSWKQRPKYVISRSRTHLCHSGL